MRSIVVSVNMGDVNHQAHCDEFVMLAEGAGAEILDVVQVKRDRPDVAFFIGSGKVNEIRGLVNALEADLVLFDQPLSPAQQRNLESELKVRVIDRIALILDIFALRAKSHEGKLQVELAQLQFQMTRLKRMWSHLERQKGGIGLRGPGESQLELDRRYIAVKVKKLKEELSKVEKRRGTQRRSRQKNGVLSVSLVGYTNAGKSTLFNALTRADTYVADQLFATLDTTSRRVWIEGLGSVVLSDTVGFIRDLPHTLIAAFKATLEEAVQADLLLHVVDSSSDQKQEQMIEINKVLEEIGANDIPQILVYNKIDCIGQEVSLDRDEQGHVYKVHVSALEKQGLDELRLAITEFGKRIGKNVEYIEY